jgi:hypothetical protein
MVEKYDDKIDVRFIPLFHRIEVFTKGIMAFFAQFTDTLSPYWSFPPLGLLALWMVVATIVTKPCCIFWANTLKMMAYALMVWTSISGYLVYAGFNDRIKILLGIPLFPAFIMFSGWAVIVAICLKKVRDETLLIQKVPHKKRENVDAWAESLTNYQKGAESVQLSKLDSLSLIDSTAFRFQTHHEILTLIFLLQSNASAGIKQRALQILAYATGSSSGDRLSKEALEQLKTIENHSQSTLSEKLDDSGSDSEDSDDEADKSISVQSRRRLLGYDGTDKDMDEADHHYPALVHVSPLALVDLLAEEFHMSKKRDEASRLKEAQGWLSEKQQQSASAEAAGDDGKKKKKKESKKERKKREAAGPEMTEAYKRTGEVLYMLSRVKRMMTVEMVKNVGDSTPQRFVVNNLLSQLRHNPPDILRLQVEGAGGMGAMMHNEELHDDHLLEHVLELPEDRLNAADETEKDAMHKIKTVRRMYAESEVHQIMKTVMGLPQETLSLREDEFTKDADEYSKNSHLLSQIIRLEEEKKLIDSEITHLQDQAISVVNKVFLMRIFAVYAEAPEFARALLQKLGADQVVRFLMHGDENLQTAATVCLYQCARLDAQCLDELNQIDGALVFVATNMTDPIQNSVITHRIAMDLLVEVAKRFELRKPLIEAGLIGPLLNLGKAYSFLLTTDHHNFNGDELDIASILRDRCMADHQRFGKSQEEDHDENVRPGSEVLTSTRQIHRWCPFKLKGVERLGEHNLLCILRVFQQLTDEDSFRAEFIGRHEGLKWIKNYVYPIQMDNIKLMSMRVIYGMAAEPFGLDDMLFDKKMLSLYNEMWDFKEDESIPEGSALIMHSRSNIVRLKMHRVAEFLSISHINGMRTSSDGKHQVRLVIIRKGQMVKDADGTMHLKKFQGHDPNVLEVARERCIEECMDIMMEGSRSSDESLRTAAVSAMTVLASKVKFLPPKVAENLDVRLLECRKQSIELDDTILYEELCVALVFLRRHVKQAASSGFGFANEEDLFDELWSFHHGPYGKGSMYHWCGSNNMEELIQRPYWDKARAALTPDVTALITGVENSNIQRAASLSRFEHIVTLDEENPDTLDAEKEAKTAVMRESPKQKMIRGFQAGLKLVKARGPQDTDEAKHKKQLKKTMGHVVTEAEAQELEIKRATNEEEQERRLQKQFTNKTRVESTKKSVLPTPPDSPLTSVKVMNPMIMAKVLADNATDGPAPEVIESPDSAPEGEETASVAAINSGNATSSSDEEDAEPKEIAEEYQRGVEIKNQLEAYAEGDNEDKLDFSESHSMRRLIHTVAQQLRLVHYSEFDSVRGHRVLTVHKPRATSAVTAIMKQKLVAFYESTDTLEPLVFEVDAEARKFMHMEAEALELVHYSTYNESGNKVLTIEQPVHTRGEKAGFVQQLVEFASDSKSPETLAFEELDNEMRKFLHKAAEGLGLNHASSTVDGTRVLNISKQTDYEGSGLSAADNLVLRVVGADLVDFDAEQDYTPVLNKHTYFVSKTGRGYHREHGAPMEVVPVPGVADVVGAIEAAGGGGGGGGDGDGDAKQSIQDRVEDTGVKMKMDIKSKVDAAAETENGSKEGDILKRQVVADLVKESLGSVSADIQVGCTVKLPRSDDPDAVYIVKGVDNRLMRRAMIAEVGEEWTTKWAPLADLDLVAPPAASHRKSPVFLAIQPKKLSLQEAAKEADPAKAAVLTAKDTARQMALSEGKTAVQAAFIAGDDVRNLAVQERGRERAHEARLDEINTMKKKTLDEELRRLLADDLDIDDLRKWTDAEKKTRLSEIATQRFGVGGGGDDQDQPEPEVDGNREAKVSSSRR